MSKFLFTAGSPKASAAGRKGRFKSIWNSDPAVPTRRAHELIREHLKNPQKALRLAAIRAAHIKVQEKTP